MDIGQKYFKSATLSSLGINVRKVTLKEVTTLLVYMEFSISLQISYFRKDQQW